MPTHSQILNVLNKRQFPPNFLNMICGNNLTLQAFWDATYPESIVKDGTGAVSSWIDRVNGVTLNQNTTSAKPFSNGQSILFDGTSDFLKTASISTWTQPITVIFVGRQVSWTAFDYLYDGYTSSTMALFQSISSPNIRSYLGSGGSLDNGGASLGAYYIITETFNGASSSISVNKYKTTGTLANVNASGLTLGARGDNLQFSNIEVLAIVVITGVPTDNQLTQIREYFYTHPRIGYLITK